MAAPLFQAFVDETGDRGWGGSASPIFIATAVIVRHEEVPDLRATLGSIKQQLEKPPDTVLHWAENVKSHSARKLVAAELAGTAAVLSNVVVMKRPMMGSGTGLSDKTRMYNYVVRRLLERLSWYARDRGGELIPTFAHVRHFPYDLLWKYIELLKTQPTSIAWQSLRKPRIDQPNRITALQAADLAAGAAGSALRPDRYGQFEPGYLETLVPRLYIRQGGGIETYGMNIIGPPGCMSAAYPWWDSFVKQCQQRPERQ